MRKTVELKDVWIRGSGRLLAYLQRQRAEELELLAEEVRLEIEAFRASGSCALEHPDCGRNLRHLRRLRDLLRQVEEHRDRYHPPAPEGDAGGRPLPEIFPVQRDGPPSEESPG